MQTKKKSSDTKTTQPEPVAPKRNTLQQDDELTPRPEDSDVTEEELKLLEQTTDEDDLNHVDLDDTDDDGEPLNEEVDLTGEDLDVPGAEEDDRNEDIGAEDEENNSYSTSDNNDDERQ